MTVDAMPFVVEKLSASVSGCHGRVWARSAQPVQRSSTVAPRSRTTSAPPPRPRETSFAKGSTTRPKPRWARPRTSGARSVRMGAVVRVEGASAGRRPGVGERAVAGDELPVVGARMQRELQHAVRGAVVNLAVRLDRAEAVQAGPAGSYHELPDALGRVRTALRVLPREALVLVVVAVEHHRRVGRIERIPERRDAGCVAVDGAARPPRLLRVCHRARLTESAHFSVAQ